MNKLPGTFLLILNLFMQTGGQPPAAVPILYGITIQNASFEQIPSDFTLGGRQQCGPQGAGHVLGWTSPAFGAIWLSQPANPNPCGNSVPPDGVSAAIIAPGNSVVADAGPPQTVDGVYTLKVSVAAYDYWYGGGYLFSVSIGTLQLCSTSGVSMGDFTEVTLVCPNQRRYPPNISGDLMISLAGLDLGNDTHYMSLVDKVSLTFAPTN